VTLAGAGVRVVAGDGEGEARRINEAFFKHRTTGQPFVIAKFAASLDGRIAAASGDSRWVSGPETRAWAHNLRTRIDAILAGSTTMVIDDPELTARPVTRSPSANPAHRCRPRGRTPPMARVFTGPAKTLVATLADSPAPGGRRWRRKVRK
jgi:diaminohydroxyphosphoribosylaminopyrimidine deaminase/5-amino-6-(5-phosphoribosylamino)uracil reductase